MEELRGKTGQIRVDYLAKKGLDQGDLVEILDEWEEPLQPGSPSKGKRRKIVVRSLKSHIVVEEIDGTDIILMSS